MVLNGLGSYTRAMPLIPVKENSFLLCLVTISVFDGRELISDDRDYIILIYKNPGPVMTQRRYQPEVSPAVPATATQH